MSCLADGNIVSKTHDELYLFIFFLYIFVLLCLYWCIKKIHVGPHGY